MSPRSTLLPLLVIVAVCGTTALAIRTPPERPRQQRELSHTTISRAVDAIDREFEARWAKASLVPAKAADDLTVYRRLSLALHGTVPSLEELRRFEADTGPDRLGRWTDLMLQDSRFADYFAERLARAYVSVDAGQFLVFRRDRFTEWLSTQLQKKVPYDHIVRSMIAGEGIWTGDPEVNFITQGYADDQFDEDKLAARTVRAFLGQRIDCAQCHDHPFAEWKQSQFQQLAACFGQVERYPVGLYDDRSKTYEIDDPSQPGEKKTIADGVPYSPEWVPASGGRRERLAAWITHPDNTRFEQAIANRVWALMFGTPFLRDRPVDDLPNPDDETTGTDLAVLDILGKDFREHGCDLQRIIRVIAGSAAFRIDSSHEEIDPGKLAELEMHWAVFPLARLRPEQVIGAMLQSNSVKTIDQKSHLFSRAIRYFRERDFVNEFGDPGDAELQERPSTIPQALLEMNGEFAQDMSNVTPFGAPGRLQQMTSSPAQLLDCAFLVCLTRHPTPQEQQQLLPSLENDKQVSEEAIQDLFWALFNCEEFNWNH